jgi:HEXXH motif-containing protein
MDAGHHRMPRDLFEALARGGGGEDAVRELAAAQFSRHLILLRGVREVARPDDLFAVQGFELLADVQRHDPAAAEAVIRHPSVGAWALRTLRGDQALPGAEPGGMAAVAAAAAIRAGLPGEIEVRVTDGKIVLPTLGATTAHGDTATVRTCPAEVRSAGRRVAVDEQAPDWQELRPVQAGSLRVLIDDLDPFRMPAADDLTPRLTATEAAALGAELRDAWPVLDPTVAAEVAATIRVIVPYVTPPAGHVSSSSPENFGAVAMSRQPDRYMCAATLVHEVQHLKLSALLDLVPLTLPDDGRRYYAPWRTDPRPVSSLLQGAYAFLGVSGFWRQQRQVAADDAVRRRADAEFARWRASAARVVTTLRSSGRLTAAGQDFVAKMARVLDSWQRERVPAEALALARREAERHLARWQADNGEAPI